MEDSGDSSGGCVVHVDVCYVVGGCNVVAILGMAGIVLSCMQKLWQYWICMICWEF